MAAHSNVPAIIRPLARYVDFSGRSTRPEFWLFLLLNYLVIGAAVAAIVAGSMAGGHIDLDKLMITYMRFGPLLSVFNLAVLLPNIAVRVRRLHDIGRSGWWVTFPYGVAMVAYIVFLVVDGPVLFQTMLDIAKKMQAASDPAALTPMAMLRLEVPLWQLMVPWVFIPTWIAELLTWVAFAWPGTKGTNVFGPNPKLGASTEVF